jgi:transposase
MDKKNLEALSKEELIEIIMQQYEQMVKMQAALEKLQADYEALKMKFEQNQKPPTSSKNSSQPPSRDQKGNATKKKGRRRHGPPKGHEKYERKLVADPNHVIEMRAKYCQNCEASLEGEQGQLVKVNQITELPEAKAQVIEVRYYEVDCPCCGGKQLAQSPVGLEMGRRFGARLEATVVYYRQEQHMSYQRTQKALLDLHGVTISQGGIDKIMKRGGKQAQEQVGAIETAIQKNPVIHCDETGSRVENNNWWEWAFCTATAVLHVLRFNRSSDVIQDVMGDAQAEVWVSDCYLAQLKSPAQQRQLCMAHQLRNLQAVVEAHPTLRWPKAMQFLFRYAIHLHHQRHQLSPQQFAERVARIERYTDRLLQQSLSPPDAARLCRRYQKYRQHLFVFLHRADVEPTNNVAERALRHSVVHRKVTGCFRSDWGANAYAALASVIDTAELAGIRAFAAIQGLFGPPALPIPVGCE